MADFDDLLAANRAYAAAFDLGHLGPQPAAQLAVVTCMDTRIDPLAIFNLRPGDAKVVRNAGARVTDDVLRTLVVAAEVLGVRRVALMAHTDCGLAAVSEEQLQRRLSDHYPAADVARWQFLAIDDHERVLRADAELVRACELLPPDLEVATFLYDVRTGSVQPVC